MKKHELYEMIDACRPGSRDLEDPELSELARELAHDQGARAAFDRSQRLDLAIGRAFREVEPPTGLAERLLTAIEATTTPNSLAPRRSSFPTRRHMAAGAALLAVAASLCWLLFSGPRLPTTEQEILAAVERWNSQLDEASWQVADSAPRDGFPDRSGLRLRAQRWQWVAKDRVVCYEYAGNVRLFVLRTQVEIDLPAAPPAGYPIGDWHVGAWQSAGLVYALAVAEGTEPAGELYRRIIARRAAPA